MLGVLLSAATPQDPIWLRTLATVLPVIGTVIVAIVGAPKLIELYRGKKTVEGDEGLIDRNKPGLPPSLAASAADRANMDPVLRVFIDDLHARLSRGHEEAAELHRMRAIDSATIARLTFELADTEGRLRKCERDAEENLTKKRVALRRLEEVKRDLEVTRRKLAICLEGGTNRHE